MPYAWVSDRQAFLPPESVCSVGNEHNLHCLQAPVRITCSFLSNWVVYYEKQDLCKLLLPITTTLNTPRALTVYRHSSHGIFVAQSSVWSWLLPHNNLGKWRKAVELHLLAGNRTGPGRSDWPADLEGLEGKLSLAKGYGHSKLWSRQTVRVQDERAASPHRGRNMEALKGEETLDIQMSIKSTGRRLVTMGRKFPSLMLSSASGPVSDISDREQSFSTSSEKAVILIKTRPLIFYTPK